MTDAGMSQIAARYGGYQAADDDAAMRAAQLAAGGAPAGAAAELDIAAALTVGVGRLEQIAQLMDRRDRQRKRDIAGIWPQRFRPQVITGANQSIDLPEEMGPKDGYAWDVRYVRLGATGTGSFGGTVYIHIDQSAAVTANDPNEITEYTNNASQFFSAGTIVLLPGMRIVLQSGSGITAAQITFSGSYVQVPLGVLSEYLL